MNEHCSHNYFKSRTIHLSLTGVVLYGLDISVSAQHSIVLCGVQSIMQRDWTAYHYTLIQCVKTVKASIESARQHNPSTVVLLSEASSPRTGASGTAYRFMSVLKQ